MVLGNGGIGVVSHYRISGPHSQPVHNMGSHTEQQFNNFQHQPNLPMNFHYAPGASNELVTSMGAMTLGNNMMPGMSSAMNPSTDLNLAANEFYPKSGPPLSHQSMLHQSASAPSFDNYAAMPKPVHTLLETVHNSPVLTPSGSPQLQPRRMTPQLSPPHNIASAASLHMPTQQQQADLVQENIQGTTYFYPKDDYISPTTRQIISIDKCSSKFSILKMKETLKTFPGYSMYVGVPPHIAHMQPNTSSKAFFIGDEIKMDLLRRQAVVMSEVEGVTDLPTEVDNYCHLVPLEISAKNTASGHFGYPHSVYKAVNQKDGLTYCLHRIHSFKLTNPKCMTVIEQWKKISSPNVVALREVFTTKSFNDNSIVFVYDYYPAAENVTGKHFSNIANGYSNPFSLDGSARPFSAGKGARNPGQLLEAAIWSYIIQISGALRIIHARHMSMHGINPSKLLVTDKSRVHINCCAIMDVLTFDPNNPVPLAQLQKEDLNSFGRLILALACNSVMPFRTDQPTPCWEHLKRNYSVDLYSVVCYLTSTNVEQGVSYIMPKIGARFYMELEAVQNKALHLEHELYKEVECGRLFRIQAKLNTILERVGYNSDSSWSETGDRYILKLFRDYVFHQTGDNGAPWLDMSHIVSCLNKLDAGVSDKICLPSANQNSVIIVSYQELKRFFDTAFNEIVQANVTQTYGAA